MMNRDAEYRAKFDERALDPASWKESARQLVSVADVMRPKMDEFWSTARNVGAACDSWRGWDDEFVATYFMLMAFAVENALKARIVEKHRDEFREHLAQSGELPKILKSQKFQKLCIAAGLESIAKEEAYLLNRLERSAIWYGRYPIPIKSGDLDRVVAAESRKGRLRLSAYSTLDSDWIRRFLSELGVRVRR